MPDRQIPYKDLKTIFLDVGNTLVSMDFEWLKKDLVSRGILCDIEELRRAEAAARPIVSGALEKFKSTESRKATILYIRSILEGLGPASSMTVEELDGIIGDLLRIIQSPGWTEQLWSWVLPGVREALEILKGRGLRLVVVSNSNGTVENILIKLNLRHYFKKVIDSLLVGFEKPDPRLFYHAMDISGAEPESSIHIGDLYHVDVIGARKAGIRAILLDPYGNWGDVDCPLLPDLVSFARNIEGLGQDG
jgi:HAD superfamily hydrolase (TIGR01509 family)